MTRAVEDEFNFLNQLFECGEQEEKQTETSNKMDTSQEVQSQQQVSMTTPTTSSMPTRTNTPVMQRQNEGGQQIYLQNVDQGEVVVVMQNEQWQQEEVRRAKMEDAL